MHLSVIINFNNMFERITNKNRRFLFNFFQKDNVVSGLTCVLVRQLQKVGD